MEEFTSHEQFVLFRTQNHEAHHDIQNRLLTIEQTYLSGKFREKILMYIASFIGGILLSGFTLYVSFSNALTSIKVRQVSVTTQQSKTERMLDRLDGRITSLIKHINDNKK